MHVNVRGVKYALLSMIDEFMSASSNDAESFEQVLCFS